MRTLRKNELQDIVVGAGLLGAGGGGSIREGMKLVDRILEFSPEVKLISPEELEDEEWGAVIAGMGSPKASLTRVRTNSPRMSLEMIEREKGFTSSFVIPFEVGAGNSMNPILAAVQKGIPIVDGDPVGRAVPELHMTTFHLGGVSMSPLALSTEDKIQVLISTELPEDIERIARAVTAELQGVSAICCNAMQGKEVRKLIIPNTTTEVEKIGHTIRSHQSGNADPTDALIRDFGGYLLGRGRIEELTEETRSGFDFGVVRVSGKIPVTVYFQNENMLVYSGDKLLAVVPDLVCAIDDRGNPLTNADLEEGMDITYIGFPARQEFRSEKAFGLFRNILEALGYTGEFVSLEELNRGR